ncbi:MAG: PIN domain-containing protein [Verrucomicrobia bacterium]|nr:PIN domain-containing protein [Verrucomicrobiota bacterium]
MLFDTNVWIAAIFTTHPFHRQARQSLQQATPALPAVFGRSTQQGFLRLTSTPALLQAYGAEDLTNRDALVALEALLALPQVCEREEPPGTLALWRRLASRDTASPKVWMDAYLAAFAIIGGLRMVSLDHDFKSFEAQGLDLVLLNP